MRRRPARPHTPDRLPEEPHQFDGILNPCGARVDGPEDGEEFGRGPPRHRRVDGGGRNLGPAPAAHRPCSPHSGFGLLDRMGGGVPQRRRTRGRGAARHDEIGIERCDLSEHGQRLILDQHGAADDERRNGRLTDLAQPALDGELAPFELELQHGHVRLAVGPPTPERGSMSGASAATTA